MSVIELTAGVFDQQTGTTASSENPSAGSITTGSNGSFSISAFLKEDGFGIDNIAAGSGYTLLLHNGGGIFTEGNEYQAQTSAGAIAGDFTSANAGPWAAAMMTFRPAGGGGGTSTASKKVKLLKLGAL
jgi:hypothetical protein